MTEPAPRIGVVIVDDEPPARRALRSLLKDDPDVELLAECRNGREAIAAIRGRRPDLVFLDVQMPEVSGFDVIEEVGPEAMPAVIFVTAYDRHTLRAFEVQALDYLLKPFSDERFGAALERAKTRIREHRVAALRSQALALANAPATSGISFAAVPERPIRRFLIKAAGRVVFIKADDVDWIEAADYYACLHVGGKTHLLRETMSELESQLDPGQFVRIHRSAIVNLDRTVELRPQSKGEYAIVLSDGTELSVGRNRRARLERALRRRR